MTSIAFAVMPTPVKCESCDWEGMAEDTLPIQDFQLRVHPGEICPYGECPKCRTVCHGDLVKIIGTKYGRAVRETLDELELERVLADNRAEPDSTDCASAGFIDAAAVIEGHFNNTIPRVCHENRAQLWDDIVMYAKSNEFPEDYPTKSFVRDMLEKIGFVYGEDPAAGSFLRHQVGESEAILVHDKIGPVAPSVDSDNIILGVFETNGELIGQVCQYHQVVCEALSEEILTGVYMLWCETQEYHAMEVEELLLTLDTESREVMEYQREWLAQYSKVWEEYISG